MDEGCAAGPPSESQMMDRMRGGQRYSSSRKTGYASQRASRAAPRRDDDYYDERDDYYDDRERRDYQRPSGYEPRSHGASRGSFHDDEPRDERPVFERKSYGGAPQYQQRIPPRELREIRHVVAPSMHAVPLPKNATVGDLREILGGKLSPMFTDPRTKVSVLGGTLLPIDVGDDYLVAGAVQFNADTSSSTIPVFHFNLPEDTHPDDFDARHLERDVRPSFVKRGGAAADNIEVIAAYPQHLSVRFDGADDSLESVARAIGHAVYNANRYPVYKVTEGKPLNFSLGYSERGSSKVVQHLDHRHAQNGKASFVRIVDEETGGYDGDRAEDIVIHAIPHHT